MNIIIFKMDKLIPNKHLVCIIQEYLREEYIFIHELLNTTVNIKYCLDKNIDIYNRKPINDECCILNRPEFYWGWAIYSSE
jgi:hypothetical protein